MGLLDYYRPGEFPRESDRHGGSDATQQQVKGLLENYGNPTMQGIMYNTIADLGLKAHHKELKKNSHEQFLKGNEKKSREQYLREKINFYNPGNIRNVSKTPKDNWTGSVPEIGYQGGEVVKDGKHAIFTSPVLGLRALFRDVGSKITEFEGDLAAIITKFAPPKDNNPTKSYIETLREELELKDGEMVTEDHLSKLVKAIVEFENDDQALIDLYLDPKVFNEAKKLSKHSLDGRGDLEAAQREHRNIERERNIKLYNREYSPEPD